MAKKTSRKSISVKGITYRRLKEFCAELGVAIARYCNDLLNERLDELGFRRFDEAPLVLWECSKGGMDYLVAARTDSEAASYVSNVLGGKTEGIEVGRVERDYDQKSLIPGILVPDEQRAALAG